MKITHESGERPEIAFLARLRRLTHLRDADIGALAAIITDRRAIANEQVLVTEGDPPEMLHILLDGWAARQKLLRDGRRHFCALMVPGDLCDVDALHVQAYDYGVVGVTSGMVARIDRRALLALCDARPPIAQAFPWLGFVDNAMLSEAAVSLARRSARQRLSHLICELALRLQAVGQIRGFSFEMPVTQEKMADALGLTAVHLNRVLRQFREDGLIDVAGRVLIIANWDGLVRDAGFSPAYLHLEGMERPSR